MKERMQEGLHVIYALEDDDQLEEIKEHLLGLAEVGLRSTRHIRLARIVDIDIHRYTLKLIWYTANDIMSDRNVPVVEINLADVTSIFKA